ncbi:FAD-binding oxidoreductase [Streptomyces sp. ISL-36]|uniref:FAD-dependent oxidoreductase n=1 Tax=Streptomyces sp. ISL-36 TaxID=2819182 RepID=UPI001BECC7C0|nr:FAD-dependent oxidoreductase [Streptomyces sp. ISL-36]MBT2444515.1 FAD-binding oxidoreductase [Streptomyces sp. ISL-36]
MITRRTLLGAGTAAAGLAVLPATPVVASTDGSRIPWSQLDTNLQGRLVLPSDSSYGVAKQLELAQFDAANPKAVAYCVNSRDVSVALRFAQDHCLPAAVRSGGHSFGGYSTTPGLIIDVSGLNGITVGSGAVNIGPGAKNVDILNALAPHGLVVSEGGCPTVAAGGFLQGGGYGFLTRPMGMACDAVTSAEVVLADGRVVVASPTRYSDLFWAIRGGGGGNFGVVTRFTVTPHVGDQMAIANLIFPYDRAADVLDAATRWLVDAPRTIGGGGYVVQPDAAPGSVPNVNIMLASRGTPAELASETSRLLSMTGAPVARQEAVLTYQQLMMMIFGCSTLSADQCQRSEKTTTGVLKRPEFGLERTRMGTTPYSHSGWADVMTAFDADRKAGQARYLDLHFFGGAANDPARTDTAYVHRDSLFSVNYRALINDPAQNTAEARAVANSWINKGFAVIDPLSNGETYQNWMDPALTDWKRSYYAENYSRLASIKAKYDPCRFFDFAQSIGSAG